MRSTLAFDPARDNPAAEPPRPDVATDQPAPTPETDRAVGPLGYSFDPIPVAIRRDRRLKAIDHWVLAILISFARWRRDSCWTTIHLIAVRLPAIRPGRSRLPFVADRTVQRSIDRLKATGHIRHERVAKPDPDQPDNRTGWRFFFNFAPVQAPDSAPPREVTKESGEVTKPAEATLPPQGEVTKESGDSLVTQFRVEVLEPETKTFNAKAFAQAEEEARVGSSSAPTAAPGRPDVSPPAGSAHREPTEAETDWIRSLAGCNAREAAAKCLSRLRDFGVLLEDDGGEVVRWKPGVAYREFPPAGHYWMHRLNSHLLAILRPKPAHPGPALAKSAPPVPDEVQSDIRGRLEALPGNPAKSSVVSAARSLTAALGPHQDHDKTVARFVKLCGEVRKGTRLPRCLLVAFRAACGDDIEKRGAAFNASVKRWDQDQPKAKGEDATDGD